MDLRARSHVDLHDDVHGVPGGDHLRSHPDHGGELRRQLRDVVHDRVTADADGAPFAVEGKNVFPLPFLDAGQEIEKPDERHGCPAPEHGEPARLH